MSVILTCFAGRRPNLEVLFKYTDWLHRHGLIAEFHLWDFTRTDSDRCWLPSALQGRVYMKIMTPVNKHSWMEYYSHYTAERYPQHVIVKMDDDIVFIDVWEFAAFIQRTIAKEETCLIMFPSIVNNGVCAYHQQQNGLIPLSLSEFPYDTFCGKLWDSGRLCQQLHEFFLAHQESWLQRARQCQITPHPLGHRISINCFAITSRNLHAFAKVIYNDDEHLLSVVIPQQVDKPVCIDGAFTVAHLAFYRQRDTGLDENEVRKGYDALADTLTNTSFPADVTF